MERLRHQKFIRLEIEIKYRRISKIKLYNFGKKIDGKCVNY